MATELCYYFAFIGVRERLTRPMPSGVRRSARSIVIALLQHRLHASRIAGACAWQRQKAEAQPRNAATGTMSDKMKSNYRIQGATGDWEGVIGLEVHAQVTSHAKMFSGATTEFGADQNNQVSMVDPAMPGTLPGPNSEMLPPA